MDDKVVRELIYVVKDLERPLLGRDAAEKLKLVNRVDTVSSDDYKTKMANKHPKLFTGLGQMKDSRKMPSHLQFLFQERYLFHCNGKQRMSWTGC